MESLFKVRVNWSVLLGAAIFILLLNPDMSWYSFLAILISLHQLLLLFYSINTVIPIRYLAGTLMCLQMFIGPALAYNGLDQYQYFAYRMQIPEAQYFAYVIPAVVCFILGLHINAGKLKGEMLNEKGIKIFIDQHKNLPYLLIGIGFISSIVSIYFSSDLAFVFYLLGGFKFIGVFMLVLSNRQLKLVPLVIVFSSIIISSLGEGMFHDLLTWLIMLGAVLGIKYKPGVNLKIIVCVSFIFLSVIIQQLKGSYRTATGQGEAAGLETFQKVYEANNDQNSLFSFASLAGSNVRINQGFIITNIMKTVPARVPFSDGVELSQILESAILPRIIAPNKLNAGDRDIFKKYSGVNLRQGTTMALSSVGDGYINFGEAGGCIFMFVLGLFFSEVLNIFYKKSKTSPILLLFAPLVFYYPIRPDCELQTILGHLIKSCFLIFVIFIIWKREFTLGLTTTWKRLSY